jgi:hypothetical protein
MNKKEELIEVRAKVNELIAVLEEQEQSPMRCPSCGCVVDENGRGHHSAADCVFVKKELEKPTECGLMLCARDLQALESCIATRSWVNQAIPRIQSYAEAYHTKKCAEGNTVCGHTAEEWMLALCDVLDGNYRPYDIKDNTALPIERCQEISNMFVGAVDAGWPNWEPQDVDVISGK